MGLIFSTHALSFIQIREIEMEKKQYSKELRDIISYMAETLSVEFPTEVFTSEYLIVSILDNKKCHANMILDNFLMSENVDELRDIYTEELANSAHIVQSNGNDDIKSHMKFDAQLNKIMEMAVVESDKLNSSNVASEHVLLSILNPNNEIQERQVFATVGIDYDFILSKCREQENKPNPRKKSQLGNNTAISIIKSKPFAKSDIHIMSQSSSHDFIDKFTININKLVREGKAENFLGRERELEQIMRILSRRKKNNVVLVGEGGVGKTSIVYALAGLIEHHKVPSLLDGKEIVALDIMALVGGTGFRGMLEERMKGIFDDLKSNSKYILFLDDMHAMMKTGSKEKDTDITDMLSSILLDGGTKVIGATSFKAYRNGIESNPSIANKMQKIVIEPTKIPETIDILKSCKGLYESYHSVSYSNDAIVTAVKLADRYITDRSLPDSAFDLIDLTGAYTSPSTENNAQINTLKERISDIAKEKEEVMSHGEFEKVDALIVEENELNKQLSKLKREISAAKRNYEVTAKDVAQTVSEITGIPTARLSIDEKQKIAKIDEILKRSVIGQDDAVDSICKVIKRNKVGLGDKSKTMANILMIGKSGTGKSLIAKKLAEEIFGDENALIRFDMSEYSEKNSVTKLIGSNPGYIGYENGGQLTEAVKNKQHCVLLLDEIEKADQEVYNIFLQLFDEGRLTDSSGKLVNFKNVIVLMTSNIGTRQASEFGKSVGFTSDDAMNAKSIIEKELKKKFSPEFINRLDKIVYFNNLTDDNLKEIVKLEMNKFNKRLSEINFELKYDDSVVDFIHNEAMKQKEYGARPIIRLIQNNLEDNITDLILMNEYEPYHAFSATCTDSQVSIS